MLGLRDVLSTISERIRSYEYKIEREYLKDEFSIIEDVNRSDEYRSIINELIELKRILIKQESVIEKVEMRNASK